MARARPARLPHPGGRPDLGRHPARLSPHRRRPQDCHRRWRGTPAFSSWPGRGVPLPAPASLRASRRRARPPTRAPAAGGLTPRPDPGDSPVGSPSPPPPRPAAPGCSRGWLTGLLPGHPAVLIAAPPHPVGIGEFGERGDISIGTGGYRLRAQMRELGEKRVLARADNAQLPEQVTVARNIGHAPRLGIFHRDTSGIMAPDTTSVSPDIHVRDRALTAVMNLNPQHLAGPAKPLHLHLRQALDFLPGELARLLLVRLAQLRIRPDGPGSQAYGSEREDHRGVRVDLPGRAEQATQPKAAGHTACQANADQDLTRYWRV